MEILGLLLLLGLLGRQDDDARPGVDVNVMPLDEPTSPTGPTIDVLPVPALPGGTADVAPVTGAQLRELARAACSMLLVGSFTRPQLEQRVAERVYPGLTWPPPANATPSHRAAWSAIQATINQLAIEAQGAGVTLCEYLRGAFPGEVEPTDTPEPGRPYQIRSGDNLYSVAGRAYGLGAGGARLQAAKDINAHPANAQLRRVVPSSTFDQSQFPPPLNVISFGVPYQVVYIP